MVNVNLIRVEAWECTKDGGVELPVLHSAFHELGSDEAVNYNEFFIHPLLVNTVFKIQGYISIVKSHFSLVHLNEK